MRTHITGLILLGVCGALLATNTWLYLSGAYRLMFVLTGAFLFVIALLGLLIALVPAVRTAFTTE